MEFSASLKKLLFGVDESRGSSATPLLSTAAEIGWVESCSGVLVSDVPETVLWSSIFPLHSSESLTLEFSLLASCQLKINLHQD
jgi:hypothetical protein